jgi:DNA-binding transcriptional LysR family regulator
MADYPTVKIRFLTDMRVFRLDYGEAHVAIRAGSAPQEPDNVVQSLMTMENALYAARSYVEQHGLPTSEAELAQHRFIGPESPDSRAPFYRWLRDKVPAEAIVFRITEPAANLEALKAGLGLGFCNTHYAKNNPDLIEVLPARPEWAAPLWIVTHVDLHRTLKVQSFLAHLKRAATEWVVSCN